MHIAQPVLPGDAGADLGFKQRKRVLFLRFVVLAQAGHQDCVVTGWAQNSVLSHQCDTLPGDSGSPLMLKTDSGWQLIGVQSSAPAAKDRWRADNRALSVTGFRDKLQALAQE
jgi:V8-like Glu-specific endopeptidase